MRGEQRPEATCPVLDIPFHIGNAPWVQDQLQLGPRGSLVTVDSSPGLGVLRREDIAWNAGACQYHTRDNILARGSRTRPTL